jgi:HEAT repeat protein
MSLILIPAGFISESQYIHIADPLRNYYAASNRLHIQRISGELLPMDQCYINLAVVESPSSDQENRPRGSSPFSLFACLNVETVDADNCVSLPRLFESQKQPDGTSLTPKRIVSDHLYHGMWQRAFNWVLWIPLRKLKRKSSTQYTFVNLFHDIYFSEHDEGKDLASSLWRTINDPGNKNKTLFILDGLDEVSQEWDSETPMHNLLLCLLNQPQVIITSRPYGMNLGHLSPFDLELETIGFNTQEVTAYITSIVKNDTRKVDSIMSFVREHTLIQGLVRIPIQLDAMCYSWDSNFMSDEPMTMTKLYEAISLKLWQKDILRLGKLELSKDMNEYDIRTLSASKIRTLVLDETNLLEGLAFIGLYNNVIEFNAIDRHWIYDSLGDALPAVPDRALKRISFLHTSDTTVMDQDRSYHFLHFTFQEFFAAQYFVKHWIRRQPILCVELRQRIPTLVRLKPQAFLRKEKYNSRYNILWRFVAGMLQGVPGGEPETEHLKRYFTELEAEPRDLLGPAHQRILMHCLNEVALDTKGGLDIRARTEEHLVRWLQFECNIHKTIFLGRERECPEHLLKTLLQEGSAVVKECVLEALNARGSMSQEILEGLVLLLGEEDLGSHAASTLGGLSSLPQQILEALVLLLKDEDPNMRFRAADALRKQSSLLQDIFKALVPLLKDEDSHIRSHAAFALGKQSTLSQEILEALVLLLKDKDLNIRSYAAFALTGQPSLPQEILEALVLLLKDKDPDLRLRAAEALRKQSSLLQDIFKALVPLLEDKDPDIRSNAALALGKQSSLPQEIVTHLVLLWKDEDSITVRFDIAEALSRRSGLPQEILESLMLLLKDKKSDIRFTATYTLARQSGLPQEILEALVPLFKDEHSNIRRMAALAFSKQSSLPQGTLEPLRLLVKHEKGSNVKAIAVNALGRQSNLPERILKDLVLLLRIEYEPVSSRVEKALRNYNYLYSILPSLDAQAWRSLYRIWLERSFREQVSCYLDDNILYIDMPEGLRRVSFEEHKLEAFRAEIEAVQTDLNIPYCNTQRGHGGGPLHAHMKRALRGHEYREPKKPRDGHKSRGRNQAA